jgi:superfamily II DNA or RNA helicase
MKFMTKDIIQKQALDSWIDKGCSGVVVMTMGSGKSKLGIDAINHCNPKRVLITSPRTNLKESWSKEFEKWGIYNWDMFGDSDEYDIQCGTRINITLENIQTCYKWNTELINKYDLIIIDEAHLVISQEYSSIVVKALQLKKKILGLTGTPNKSDEFKAQFYKEVLPIVFEYNDSAKDGLINHTMHYIFRYDLTDEFKIKVGNKTKSWTAGELSQYQYLSERFEKAKRTMAYLGAEDFFKTSIQWMKGIDENGNKLDKQFVDAGRGFFTAIRYRKEFLWNLESSKYWCNRFKDRILQGTTNKVLIFSALTAQASKLSKYSIHSKKDKEVNDKLLQDFNLGIIRELSSCDMLTLGLNLKNAKYAIMESFNGSNTSASQRVGRLNRLSINDLGICIWIVPNNTQSETWIESALLNVDKEWITEIINVNEISI